MERWKDTKLSPKATENSDWGRERWQRSGVRGNLSRRERSRDISSGEFFYKRDLSVASWFSHAAPTCDPDCNVPSWERPSLTAQHKVATKSFSITLSHFTSLHGTHYLAFLFFIFFCLSPSPILTLFPTKKLPEGQWFGSMCYLLLAFRI